MEDSLLTKCPHCKTLFRIKYEHLAVADGEVRCGVCFKVFSAPEQGLSYSEGTGSRADATFGRTEQPAAVEEQKKEQEQEKQEQPVPSPEGEDAGAAELSSASRIESQDETPETPEAEPDALPSAEHLAQLDIADERFEAQLYTPPAAPSGRPVLWSGLAAVAMLILALQWLWFNNDKYAYHPKLHAWYDGVCRAVGCSLPEYRDIEHLHSERLEVRSHPDYSNVLLIDMIVSNSGIAAQKLPQISMSFFDINGTPIAQRIFTPHDYLENSSQALRSLPRRAPVQISFAILDPGEQAVNYAVEFN